MVNIMETSITKFLTPYKYGKPVLEASGIDGSYDRLAVDCPFIFFHQGQYHMLHVGFDGVGYQTALAVSDDLIHWKRKGIIFRREMNNRWDKIGAAGTWILKSSNNLYEVPTLKKVHDRYWMVYHSYPGRGYEEGPAEMGIAWCDDESLLNWNRMESPILSWKMGLDWEKGGLYKACIIEHEGTYYMFYNAKDKDRRGWIEQTGVAISKDLLNWERYENNPVISITEGGWDSVFASDPCVCHDGEKWVMFYYGYNRKHAQDGIAFSDDLFHWEKSKEPILRVGNSGEIDEIHAHKPSIVWHKDNLFHFYCAVRNYQEGDSARNLGNEFRCISVATSKKINAE